MAVLEQPSALMMIGVPGSGKTTFARQAAELLELTYVCPDDIREELTGDVRDQSKNEVVWQEARRQVQEALEADKSVIIDATYTKEVDRHKDIATFREYGARAVIGVFVDTPVDVAMHRNSKRKDNKVPPYVIRRMQTNLVNSPPSKEDGFDEVLIVRNGT